MGSRAGKERRVSGKLLIKYESILCHLSGHVSASPLGGRGVLGWRGVGWGGRGKSIRQTEGRDKCLIHQSNYIMAIIEWQLDIMGWTRWVHFLASFRRLKYIAFSKYCPGPLGCSMDKSNTNDTLERSIKHLERKKNTLITVRGTSFDQ